MISQATSSLDGAWDSGAIVLGFVLLLTACWAVGKMKS